MAKFAKTGSYKDKDGNYFVGRAGDNNPGEWEYAGPTEGLDIDDEKGAVEKRAESAPENRMEPAPENRARK